MGLLFGQPSFVRADTADAPALVISQLKITSSNGQFITLYNTTDKALDMTKYQLEYFNNYDLTKATSSRLIALSGVAPPHGYYMVNDSALLLCYKLTVNSLSLGLSSTAGLVEVLAFNQVNPGSSVTPQLQDYVGWSKTVASGAQTLPISTNAFLQRQPSGADNNPLIALPGTGSWQIVQPDNTNSCNIVTTTTTPTIVATGFSQLLPSSEPPATVVNMPVSDDPAQADAPHLPAADIGLMAPKITEVLPNPTGTGNDDIDEFIELYNANSLAFDLSGFSLQVGTTSLHTYKFPAGTNLASRSFTAFSSADTGLSLSNSGGQVKLLDPFGNSISATDVYGTAKDGQAWALAKGRWYWTTKLTPGTANTIELPVTIKKTATKKAAAKKSSPVKTSKTATSAKTSTAGSLSGHPEDTPTTPIHYWTLALIAGLALLYGLYEYRTDLANRIYQLRRYLSDRRANRA